MLCVSINGPSFEKAHQQITNVFPYADCIELRLDSFDTYDCASIKRLRSHFSIPMIFCLRSLLQGGKYGGSEDARLVDIRRLASLEPEYLDIESQVPKYFIEEIASRHPNIKIILSHHDFEKTPEDLEGLYQKMKTAPAFFYKIAVTPQNSVDALRLLCWARSSDDSLIIVGMGPYGQICRILSQVTYASIDAGQESAPGQIPAKILIERYRYHTINAHTPIYGLIGDPVEQSIGDVTHNRILASCSLNAVYVKMRVKPEELADFLQLARRLPFQGLSVTMPLKEPILSHLDDVDPVAQSIGAVNTLLFKEGKIIGYNTDGIGALNALEKECLVKGKRIVIIGAGGAAKAIAYEAIQRGALVTILNRTKGRAHLIANELHCKGEGLDYMKECAKTGYDILINCTPDDLPIAPENILPQAIVMDIVTKPQGRLLLEKALEKGCRVVYGYKMFVEQAAGQFSLWLN